MQLISAVLSAGGRVRENNEDNFYICGTYNTKSEFNKKFFYDEETSMGIFAVYDGMGGEAYGEEASLAAAETLINFDSEIIKNIRFDFASEVNAYIEKANEKVCNLASKHGNVVGTTIAALCINEDSFRVFNLGDSSVYLIRGGKTYLMTKPHTQVERLVSMGLISREVAKKHPRKNNLTQYIGISKKEMIIEPYISEAQEIRSEDIFIVCSDGISDVLEDDEISKIIDNGNHIFETAEEMLEMALHKGSKDNLTLIIVKIFN